MRTYTRFIIIMVLIMIMVVQVNATSIIGTPVNSNISVDGKVETRESEPQRKIIGEELTIGEDQYFENDKSLSIFEAVVATKDGGYAILAKAKPYNEKPSTYIYKFDVHDNVEWIYKGEKGEIPATIEATDDGGFLYTYRIIYENHCYVTKVDKSGKIEWQKKIDHYDGTSFPRDVIKHKDGYIVYVSGSGTKKGGLFILKIDKEGNDVWKKDIPEGAYWSIDVNKDNEIFVFGAEENDNEEHFISVLKLDSEGNQLWKSTKLADEYGAGLYKGVALDDGGCIAVGFGQSKNLGFKMAGETDGLYARFDKDGNQLWFKHVGTRGLDYLEDITETRDGNFLIASSIFNYGGFSRIGHGHPTLLKIDCDGNILEHYKLYEESGRCRDIAMVGENKYVVVGFLHSIPMITRMYVKPIYEK